MLLILIVICNVTDDMTHSDYATVDSDYDQQISALAQKPIYRRPYYAEIQYFVRMKNKLILYYTNQRLM